MVRDIGGGEVMEIRWRPPTKAEVREIVRRYHDVPNEATVTPFDVIEFEKRLHAGASNEFYSQGLVLNAVQRRLRLPAPRLFDELLEEIRGFSTEKGFTDDVCLVGVELASTEPEQRSTSSSPSSS